MKKLSFLIIATIMLCSIKMYGQVYQHRMTEQEKKLMPEYLKNARSKTKASAPSGTIRPVAEFERTQGVLIAYPLGISYSVIAEMAKSVTVTTIVSSSTQATQVKSEYQSKGINVTNCNFLIAPHDSYWTRDYGPLFIAGDQKIEIVDFIYNRPRVNDDNIPIKLATFLSVNAYSMNLVQTGGNYMNDGISIAASTDLVWDENTSISHSEINQLMLSNLGVTNYIVREDPQGEYIKHVDCWGKFLDVDKILIAKVPTSNANYSKYEAAATFFANQTTSWGNKYQVYRVNSPNGEPYTNSYILNNKVLVPQTGSANDANALAAYRAAMPGYTVIGFTGSWESTDALHCRVHEIPDLKMLKVSHTPTLGTIAQQNSYLISAQVKAYSGQSVYPDSTRVFYKVNSGNYQSIKMTLGTGNTYTASIPQQPAGSIISYYIHTADYSGRRENHPLIGNKDPHVFTISGGQNLPVAEFIANVTNITTGATVQFADKSTNSPTSWTWTFQGGTPSTSTSQNPAVIYSTPGTYNVTLLVSNSAGNNSITKTGYITVSGTSYCSSKGNNSTYEWIAQVKIGAFLNSSAAAGYTDFTGKIVNLTAGASASITLTPGFKGSAYKEYWRIWIDYNKDGDFTDANELAFDAGSSSSSAINGTINVPSSVSGSTRMRIAMKYNGASTPCEAFSYGEVEDYTVSIGSSIAAPRENTTISAFTAQIFPNPSNGNFKLEMNGKGGDKIITVYNISGAPVYKSKLSNDDTYYLYNIEIPNASKGIYIVEIICEGEVIRKSIIIN
ncbi:MAG: PKD domain-containing protein [Bacteroidales bacterium]|nr:MAG: PKD domain-containing protein [Bacteroidales bacterium]